MFPAARKNKKARPAKLPLQRAANGKRKGGQLLQPQEGSAQEMVGSPVLMLTP